MDAITFSTALIVRYAKMNNLIIKILRLLKIDVEWSHSIFNHYFASLLEFSVIKPQFALILWYCLISDVKSFEKFYSLIGSATKNIVGIIL